MFTEVQYLKTNCINRIIFKTQLIFTKFTKTNFVDFDINTSHYPLQHSDRCCQCFFQSRQRFKDRHYREGLLPIPSFWLMASAMATKCSKNLLAMSSQIQSRRDRVRDISSMMEQKKAIHAVASACTRYPPTQHIKGQDRKYISMLRFSKYEET